MRTNNNNNNNFKRNRSRNQNRRSGNGGLNLRGNSFDSSGPEIRVRGSAVQVNEKYMALGNDSYLSGDRIQAESYFQHAEHYYRVFMLANGGVDPRRIQSEDKDNESKIKKINEENNGKDNSEIEIIAPVEKNSKEENITVNDSEEPV